MSKATKSIAHDSLITIITSFSVIALGLLIPKLLAMYLDSNEVNNYFFIRRFISLVFPFTTLSIGAGLTRELAKVNNDTSLTRKTLNGTFYFMLFFTIFLALCTFLIPWHFFNSSIFVINSPEAYNVWLATIFWLVSYNCYIFLYSKYRGEIEMKKANIVFFGTRGLAPTLIILILIMLQKLTIFNLLIWWGIAYLFCLPFIIHSLKQPLQNIKNTTQFAFQTAVTYSLPRIPAGLLLGVLPFLLPLLLKKADQSDGLFLSGSYIILSVFYLSDPLAQVFLPRSSMWFQQNEKDKISSLVSKIITSTLFIGIIVSLQVYIWGDLVIRFWLGPEYAEAATVIKYLAFTTIPAFLYAPLRSILDGIERKPLITHFLTFSVIICSLMSFIFYFCSILTLFTASIILSIYYILNIVMISCAIYQRVRFRLNLPLLLESLAISALPTITSLFLHKLPWHSSIWHAGGILSTAGLITLLTIVIWFILRKPIPLPFNRK